MLRNPKHKLQVRPERTVPMPAALYVAYICRYRLEEHKQLTLRGPGSSVASNRTTLVLLSGGPLSGGEMKYKVYLSVTELTDPLMEVTRPWAWYLSRHDDET